MRGDRVGGETVLVMGCIMHPLASTLSSMARTMLQRPSDCCRDATQQHARAVVIHQGLRPRYPVIRGPRAERQPQAMLGCDAPR
jgi:hypothetical protein